MKKYAIVSVSDKSGMIEFCRELNSLGYEILATGNSAKQLFENEISCTEIKDYTGFPEIFSGRVKTLNPKIFGGILMRREFETDIKQAEENQILPIDIVCVNLYPFPKVVDRDDISLEEKIENIDIGGPSLIRAAAKNYQYVSVLTDPSQYFKFLEELKQGEISIETRSKLAAKAFSYTSFYDTLIANYLEKEFKTDNDFFRINFPLKQTLRYGENPHQKAFVYGNFDKYFEILQGKEISYNNTIDLVASVELIEDLPQTSCAIIKHTNPCGAAVGKDLLEAYTKALSSDPVSAFGGIVAFNGKVDLKLAEKLNEIFLEIIVAEDFDEDAIEVLKQKKNRRIVKKIKSLKEEKFQFKNIPGGILVQEKDFSEIKKEDLKLVTKSEIPDEIFEDLKFAWVICKHTKSNGIVFAKDKMILGTGAGQMSRLDSVKIAVMKAKEHGHNLENSVAASDAFFPFADGLIEIAKAGAKAVIQPGGSVRDEEVIAAANENNVAMVFTGIRNFKH